MYYYKDNDLTSFHLYGILQSNGTRCMCKSAKIAIDTAQKFSGIPFVVEVRLRNNGEVSYAPSKILK